MPLLACTCECGRLGRTMEAFDIVRRNVHDVRLDMIQRRQLRGNATWCFFSVC